MSLPPAPKDISANPQGGAVTDPVNKVQKDADIDRKLRLYGVIEAFRRGRMPDNHQIDETLAYVRDHSPVDVDKLSPDGKKLIQDVRDIVETARIIVAEKNADELFQNFIWHTTAVDVTAAKQDPNDVVPVTGQQLQQDKEQAVQHLRTLLSLVLTNSEARKLFADLTVMGRDLLATGAVKAAEMLRPDDERLNRVDQAAPDNKFVSKDGREVGPNETPVPEVRIPGTDTRVAQHPREELGQGAEIRTANGDTMRGEDLQRQAQDRLGDAVGTAQERYPDVKDGVAQQAQAHKDDIQQDVDSAPEGQKGDVAKTGFKAKMQEFRDGMFDRIPQEHKDKAQDHFERGKQFLSEEYFPEERRDQFIYRGKKVIVECQRHDDYQASIKWLLGLLETYSGHAQNVAGVASDSHGKLSEDPSLQQAFAELRTLLERFANGQSMQNCIDAINNLYQDANNDEEFRNWFKDVDGFVRKVLLEPGFVLDDRCNEEGKRVRDAGRRFYDEKYSDHFDRVFNEIGSWFGEMGNDPLNVRFGEDWGRLAKDLLFDSEGSLAFKPELWNDIRKVILPSLIDQVGYVPIPRVEYASPEMDLVLENLTLSGRNLFPNIISMEAHNYFKFSPYSTIPDEGAHEVTFTLSQIQADMRDIAFYVHRKTGAIKIRDQGIADVIVGGHGLTATIHLASAGKDKSSVFKVKNVNVKVDTLKFAIRDSRHETLYKILKPLATGLVKKQVARALEGAIQTALEYVDGQLVTVRDRMAEAKRTEGASRTDVLTELFQRKQAETASLKSTTSQFKVVSKRDSVILQDKGHPGGIVNRQAELQQAAGDGKEWRSKAFSIVDV